MYTGVANEVERKPIDAVSVGSVTIPISFAPVTPEKTSTRQKNLQKRLAKSRKLPKNTHKWCDRPSNLNHEQPVKSEIPDKL
jgi:hypothetical protein